MSPAALALLVLAATGDEVSPKQAAAIEHANDKAQAEVAKKYGDKKSTELTGDERREMIREQANAEKQVLEKEGVDPKTWATQNMRRNREATAQVKDEKAALVKKDEADAKAKAAPDAPGEIPVQRGFDDEHPVILEEKPGAAPIVEKELPPEAVADQRAAEEASGGSPAPAAAKPAAKAPGRGKPAKRGR